MKRSKHFWKAATVGCLALMMAIPTLSAGESVSFRSKLSKSSPNLECRSEKGKWLSGDFHQHTWYTDGSTAFDFVMEKSNEYGLDWWANSEHGGSGAKDGEGVNWLNTTNYPVNPIKGDNAVAGKMWRWQSLTEYAYPDILKNRAFYPDKRIISGLEWNVPGHEHCSTAIVAEDASAISAFEYQFDKSDVDTSRNGESRLMVPLANKNKTHDDAVKPTGDARQQTPFRLPLDADAISGKKNR